MSAHTHHTLSAPSALPACLCAHPPHTANAGVHGEGSTGVQRHGAGVPGENHERVAGPGGSRVQNVRCGRSWTQLITQGPGGSRVQIMEVCGCSWTELVSDESSPLVKLACVVMGEGGAQGYSISLTSVFFAAGCEHSVMALEAQMWLPCWPGARSAHQQQ